MVQSEEATGTQESVNWDLFRFEISLKIWAVGAVCSPVPSKLPPAVWLWFSERPEHIECFMSLLFAYSMDRRRRPCFPKGRSQHSRTARKRWAAACFSFGFGPALILTHEGHPDAKKYVREWGDAVRHLLVVRSGLHLFTCPDCSVSYVERIVRRLQQEPSKRLPVFRP